MRRAMVAGNWKMHTTGQEAEELALNIREHAHAGSVDVILCPPSVWLDRVRRVISGSTIGLGAQDMYWEDWGAFTGEISPVQVAELCEYVIVGHSERRRLFGDTDEDIARKCAAARRVGLTPILAVGEDAAQREVGASRDVVDLQLRSALGTDWSGRLVVAYEPLWAIGSGTPATPEYAQEMASFLRSQLEELVQDAAEVPVLYGGSVTSETFPGFISRPDIDGALVGGASLDATEFVTMIQQASAREGLPLDAER